MAAPPRRRRRPRDHRTAARGAASAGSLIVLVLVVLACGAGAMAWHATKSGASATARDGASGAARPGTGFGPDAANGPDTADGARSTPDATSSPKPGGTPDAASGGEVPVSGTGDFRTANATGAAAGHGDIRRYQVQVEGGIDLSPGAAAREIAAILADPRGWTADGHDGFQLVSSGPADFVVKIATPDTVDAICGAAGLDTHGEVNCDVVDVVVVNLKRWILGSPEFHGPIGAYRALIVNHEVGHRIGHGHEGCPGPGRPAPVMMQQIYGLHGCTANQWPYDARGRYIQGPPAP